MRTACSPSLAISTTRPAACSSSAATSWLTGLSSTNKTRAPWCFSRKAFSNTSTLRRGRGGGRATLFNRCIRPSSSIKGVKGLSKTTPKPAAFASGCRPSLSWAEISTMGGGDLVDARMRCAVSIPSIPGITQSISTSAYGSMLVDFAAIMAKASLPLAATSARRPSARSMSAVAVRASGRSSTTRLRKPFSTGGLAAPVCSAGAKRTVIQNRLPSFGKLSQPAAPPMSSAI